MGILNALGNAPNVEMPKFPFYCALYRKHKQEDYRGLSEDILDSLWYLCRQYNIS